MEGQAALLTLRPAGHSHLSLNSQGGAGAHVEVTRLLDQTYSRSVDAPHDFPRLGALELDLVPGRYRVRVLDGGGHALLDEVYQLLPGTHQEVATP